MDEIAAGLRKRSFSLAHHGEHRRVVFVDSAEAAVLAAADARTQEIVEEIRDGITMIADNEFEEGANDALESALGLIARRFPNGGTHK